MGPHDSTMAFEESMLGHNGPLATVKQWAFWRAKMVRSLLWHHDEMEQLIRDVCQRQGFEFSRKENFAL